MASDEIQSLRDQVQRLYSALSRYQEKYPPLELSSKQLGDDGSDETPWITDKSVLSPLLLEYDANIKSLQDQVDEYKQSQKDLRGQVDKLVAENKRLTRELKESVQTQLETLDIKDLQPTVGDDQLLHNIQNQLQMSLQEKESAMEMWQAAVQEVERLEAEAANQGFHPRLQSLEHQANQIKGQYVATVAELNAEVSSLQEELRKSRNEQKASSIQVSELRRTLEEMKKELMRKEQERNIVHTKGEKAGSEISSLAQSNQELETKLEDTRREMKRVQEERHLQQQKILELQKKSLNIEQREYEAVVQVRDSVQMAENAMLEKDQALVREKQALEQVEHLQEAIGKLVDEAGARTRKEVDSIKQQCNQNITRLMEEIHSLELEGSERQAQLDRAIREKRAVESELEKIYQEGMVKGSKENIAYEELNQRACHAERLRDEALAKLEAAEGRAKRSDMEWGQKKKHLQTEVQQLRDRVETLGQEFETASEDRVRLLEEVDLLKRKMSASSQELSASQRNFTKQMTCMERDLKMKETEYEVKLQALEDSHRHAMMELRQLLAAQQRMSAKWKEECQTITHKFEMKVNDLRSEESRQKKRIEELTKLLKESRDKLADAETMLSEYSHNIHRMETRVKEAENRASSASAQVSQQMGKARSLLYNSRNTQQLSSSLRSGGAEPLAMSDLITNGSIHKASVHFSSSTQGGEEDRANR